MTTYLYTCRHIPDDGFVITKLGEDFDALSRYTVSHKECSCPQGNKPTCRHRKMLRLFIDSNHVDDGWFLNWDNRQWRPALSPEGVTVVPFRHTKESFDQFIGVMEDTFGPIAPPPSPKEAEQPPEVEVDRPPSGGTFRDQLRKRL